MIELALGCMISKDLTPFYKVLEWITTLVLENKSTSVVIDVRLISSILCSKG